MPPKRFSRDDYKVAWICPLEVEEIAALEMLDEEHESLNVPSTDSNIYHLGAINSHNVVIIGLPRPGNCPAATVITQMKMTFPNLKYGLLVGIGGGVPVKTDRGMIRLGHVVVSEPTGTHSGAVQYDHGKAKTGEFERTGYLQPPPTALLNAARELSVQRQRMDVDPVWSNTQRIDTSRSRFRHFKFPGVTNDYLYQPNYKHRQEGLSCEDGGCDPKQRIERSIDEFHETFVIVHRGTVASGELVLKNAEKRDYLSRKYGVLCFEMEAAGASTDFPCMVIRGISDYCDSHKNDVWHGYAAAVAAAYARQLFFHMSVEEETGSSNPTPHAFELPCDLTEIAAVHYFVAREYELEQMHKLLSGPDGRLTAILYGTGGMGKTQLAIEYMRRYSCDYPVAIWLNAKNEITLKRSFARVAERIQRLQPSLIYFAAALESRDLDDTWKAVKRWLEEPMNKRWIVTYDNYDDPLDSDVISVCPSHATGADPNGKSQGNEGTVDPNAFDIRPYLPKASHGSIIVTTRSSLVTFGPCIKVDKLEDVNDSLEILVQASRRESLREDPDAIKLVQRLDGLPLAIATAGAYLDQIAMRCDEYLQLYHDSWLQLQKKSPRLTYYDQTLYSTWNISYSRIEQQSPVAAKLLRQWAYFSNEDLWYELLKEGGSHGADWLQELTGVKFEFDDIMRILCNHGLVAADLATSI
ncbi:nb-arc and tpr domain-containing protein [Cordyceps javanica]|uniref:Nb-arc and tpr domain-containing protein n=1 Tax=Cordyceps javanica TaxID=43265 RepID=A0A545V1B7_9HYPO|nr:nb-arc and tpr domain-containing protein [Cordyceps javanica]